MATLAPELSVQLEGLLRAGNYEGAAVLARRVRPLLECLYRHGGGTYISAIKAGLTLRGIPAGVGRPPVRALTVAEVEELKGLLEDLEVAGPMTLS